MSPTETAIKPEPDTQTTADYTRVHPVPGHGLPLNAEPQKNDPFYVRDAIPSALVQEALDHAALRFLTLRERAMVQFVNAVTDKESWWTKVNNPSILAKWKSETVNATDEDEEQSEHSEDGENEEDEEDGENEEEEEDTEDTEGDEDDQEGENGEDTEEAERSEDEEKVEEPEDSEEPVNSEDAEDSEASEVAEDAEDAENSEASDESEESEEPEDAEESEESEHYGESEDDDDSDDTKQTDFTPRMFEYVTQELQHLASSFDPSSPYPTRRAVPVLGGRIVKSDFAVPEHTRLALGEAIRVLEDVPDSQKDWHPGSKKRVLDLVHPSLYPLVYGVTRVLPLGSPVLGLGAEDCVGRCGEGEVLPTPTMQDKERGDWQNYFRNGYNPYSDRFQWLPCEVDVSGEKARITSYINNLHPSKHAPLYSLVEDLIDAAIPLWNITLGALNHPNRAELRDFERFKFTEISYTPEYDQVTDEDFPPRVKEEYEDGNATDEDYEARMDKYWEEEKREWWEENREVNLPEPVLQLPFDAKLYDKIFVEDTKIGLREVYGERGRPLQVIVKIANIELGPGKERYNGGAWHVEGKLSEHICATAIYYHSCENITPSSLAFRHLVEDYYLESLGEEYDRHEDSWFADTFGIQESDTKLQNLGAVDTRQGRLITFPNVVQHRVQPFELVDKTQRGWRKIVALFLVDPNVRVVSTARVPVQRMDWWREMIMENAGHARGSDAGVGRKGVVGLERLPLELQDKVFSEVEGFPISEEDAKRVRKELMEERKVFGQDYDGLMSSRMFSLCEH